MVALQIRDVPEDVRDALVDRARAEGKSLQAYLLALVEADARRSANRTVLRRFADRRDGSRVSPGETADELRAQRAERDDSLRER
jgi:hypothetical protein